MIRVQVDGADIELRVERELAPQIRGTRPIELTHQGGDLVINMAAAPRGPRPRLEILLAPEQSLLLEGADLNLDAEDAVLYADELELKREERQEARRAELDRIRAARESAPAAIDEEPDQVYDEDQVGGEISDGDEAGDDDEADGEDEEDDAPRAVEHAGAQDEREKKVSWLEDYGVFTFTLENSQVSLRGLRNIDLEARTCSTLLIDSAGPLLATVNGGRFETEKHRGKIDLLITDSEAKVSDLQGTMNADQLGGVMALRAGSGGSLLNVVDGDLQVEARRGRLEVDGEGAIIDLRRLSGGNIFLRGQRHDVRMRDSQVYLQTQQVGGRLEIRGGDNQLHFQGASDLSADIEDYKGRIRGILHGGEVQIRAPEARMILDAEGTRFEIDGLRQLQVGGQALEIQGRGLVAIQRLEVTDSTLDLDISELIHDLHAVLAGATRARFEMSSPCVVKIGGRRSLDRAAEVIGCDLRSLDQTAVSARSAERYGHGLRRLTLMLSGEPEVEVEGR